MLSYILVCIAIGVYVCAHEEVQVLVSAWTCMLKLYVYEWCFQSQLFMLTLQAWSLSVPDAHWFRTVSKVQSVSLVSSSPELGLYMCTTAYYVCSEHANSRSQTCKHSTHWNISLGIVLVNYMHVMSQICPEQVPPNWSSWILCNI